MTGDELKDALRRLGWSQEELAHRLDVDRATIARQVRKHGGKVSGPIAAYVDLAEQVQTWGTWLQPRTTVRSKRVRALEDALRHDGDEE